MEIINEILYGGGEPMIDLKNMETNEAMALIRTIMEQKKKNASV